MHLYAIPSHHAFVDALAAGIIERFGEAALASSNMLLLLPNRRSAQALKDAFLRRSAGKATLLPRMMPLGDMDEDELAMSLLSEGKMLDVPPAIAPVRQQIILAKLTHEWRKSRYGDDAMFVHSLKLAGELVRFLSEVEREQLSLENLEEIYPEEFQDHWKDTLTFLKILLEHWPDMLAEQQAITLAQYRNRMMELQAKIWQDSPPDYPVIAAGVTGTFPAATELLSVISHLPNGYVVLPGLDQIMGDGAWQAIEETHPQYEMKQLLDKVETEPYQVALWANDEALQSASSERLSLVSQLMLPATHVEAWRKHVIASEAYEQLSCIEAASLHEEAGVISLMLREVLEEEGKVAALVTHDRNLANHVVMALKRWGVNVNDSAGKPLSESPPVVFLRLVASLIEPQLNMHQLLSCLKHPYCALGYTSVESLQLARRMEQILLRGVCVARTPKEWLKILSEKQEDEALFDFVERVDAVFSPLFELGKSRQKLPILSLIEKLIAVAEKLATTDQQQGVERLWASDAAEQFQQWYQQLQHIHDLPQSVYPQEAESLLEALMEGVSYRPRYGLHPRLHILGPLEARLQPYDLLILGGLNEGSWPSLPSADPWMSRPMRAQFGLPLPERRIGQAAHDFMQYFCASEVVLTRSRKIDGAETTPSRWWMRLHAVLKASKNEGALVPKKPWLEWYQRLYAAEEEEKYEMPQPVPPLSLRPRGLSATNIETLQQNPYAIYAKYILKLKALDDIDKVPAALEFGNFVHDMAEYFAKHTKWDECSEAELKTHWCELSRQLLQEASLPATIKTIWQPRIERIVENLAEVEIKRRSEIQALYSEIRGSYTFETGAGTFTLTAKADRIEIDHDNQVTIIDYKTGQPPSLRWLENGVKSQLPLEMLIVLKGEFEAIKQRPEKLKALAYWQVSGRKQAFKVAQYPNKKQSPEMVEQWVDEAEQGIKALIAWFDEVTHAYIPYPYGSDHLPFDDYAHLIREEEWSQ